MSRAWLRGSHKGFFQKIYSHYREIYRTGLKSDLNTEQRLNSWTKTSPFYDINVSQLTSRIPERYFFFPPFYNSPHIFMTLQCKHRHRCCNLEFTSIVSLSVHLLQDWTHFEHWTKTFRWSFSVLFTLILMSCCHANSLQSNCARAQARLVHGFDYSVQRRCIQNWGLFSPSPFKKRRLIKV